LVASSREAAVDRGRKLAVMSQVIRPGTTDLAGDSVLGTIQTFYTPGLIVRAQAKGVTANDFRQDRQRVVYRAFLALHKQGVHVDALMTEAFLARHDCLERAGGVAYLELLTASASPAAFDDHAWLVAESGRWGRILRAFDALEKAVVAQDDKSLREAMLCVARDVLPEDHEPLRVIEGGKERDVA
jgi:replicative DNA helicase